LERARIIDAALRLSDIVEKSAANMRKSGADDEADGMMATMLELMGDLKDALMQPEYMTAESARQFAAKIDGLVSYYAARTPRMSSPRKMQAVDDTEEADDVEEDDDVDTIQKAVRRRLRGEIGEDALMRLLNFKVG
jgi:hypothetical protein